MEETGSVGGSTRRRAAWARLLVLLAAAGLGAVIMRWSRLAWALVFGTVTFLWWQLLLNQNGAYAAAFQQTSVQLVIGVLVLFMVTTGGIWAYFRFNLPAEEAAA